MATDGFSSRRRGAISTLRFEVNTATNIDDPESLYDNGEMNKHLDCADM